jgi:hypothetical protein
LSLQHSETGEVISPSIKVLGKIFYTQYNIPDETVCQGGGSEYWLVTDRNKCIFEKINLNDKFAAQVYLNGTGRSVEFGLLHTLAKTLVAKKCTGKYPPGATDVNSFVPVSDVVGTCNQPLVPDYSVVVTDLKELPCGTLLSLVDKKNLDFAGRRSDDRCYACKNIPSEADGHIDSYSSAIFCTSREVGSLGTYWTSVRNIRPLK